MNNPYSGEWDKITALADNIKTLLEKIRELQAHAVKIQAMAARIPRQEDENGNDLNAGRREALYAQLESVRALIEETDERRSMLSADAMRLSRSYQASASEYEKDARKATGVKSGFERLSTYRFGTAAASAAANVSGQRAEHYQSYVRIFQELAAAAQSAANGISTGKGTQTVAERGVFANPNAGGAHAPTSNIGSTKQTDWKGTPGESIKLTRKRENEAAFSNLNMEGLPYQNGNPVFSPVSHAVVPLTGANVAAVAAADALLAKKYGITSDDVAQYREENELEWRDDVNGAAYLIPRGISEEYDEGRREVKQPSAQDALTAYMWAHNYGEKDASIYMKDPKWKKLHRAAFPDYKPNYPAMIAAGILSGKFSDMIEYEDFKEKPKVVGRSTFYEYVKETGVICFRTFNDGKDGTPAKQYKERFYADSAKDFKHNGTGNMTYGEGVYLTINNNREKGHFPTESVINTARDASLIYGKKGARATACVTISSDAKIGDAESVRKEFKKLPFAEQQKYCTQNYRIPGSGSGIASFAIANGYDGLIWKRAGIDCDYLTMYNRQKIIVLDDPDNQAFGIS